VLSADFRSEHDFKRFKKTLETLKSL